MGRHRGGRAHPPRRRQRRGGQRAPRGQGPRPAAFKATYDWLHAAFEGLRWEVRELAAEGDLVAVRVIWHAANRDDLGQARQLGWVPPSPAFLVRSGLARRRLGRGGQSSSIVPPVRQ